MTKQTLTNPCAVNCAVDFIGICLNLNFDGVLSKAVKRSATNTTPNLTTHLNEAGIWLALNLLHIVISFNLYSPLHTLLLCPTLLVCSLFKKTVENTDIRGITNERDL